MRIFCFHFKGAETNNICAMMAGRPMLYAICLFGVLVRTTCAASASPSRIPTETGGNITVTRARGEQPFNKSGKYTCIFGRKGQFSIVLPPKNYRQSGVHVSAPAIVVDDSRIMCQVPRVVTAGNTTVCIAVSSSVTRVQTHFKPLENDLPKVGKKNVCKDTTYAPAYLTHFPLFSPAFDRRPWFREVEGALLVHLDMAALQGVDIRKISPLFFFT